MDGVVGNADILVEFYILPSQGRIKVAPHPKETPREPLTEIRVHAVFKIHSCPQPAESFVKEEQKMGRGDSGGTANIQTVWHDKDAGVSMSQIRK